MIGQGFDRLAPVYEPLAWLFLAGAIPRSQRLLLDLALQHAPGRILVVGGGAGGFLLQLIGTGYAGEVLCLDVSFEMLRRSRRRLAAAEPEALPRIEFRQGDLGALGGDDRFDLVCTHYVLDLFPPVELVEVMRRIGDVLRPGARWHHSDFTEPAGVAQRALLAGLYRFFRATCRIRARELPPIRATFERLGYSALERASPGLGWLETAVYVPGTEKVSTVGSPPATPSCTTRTR